MMVRVRVKGSPYRAVKRGAIGRVVERKFLGTPSEILKVRFQDDTIWSFYPDELEVLDDEEV
jgi:hypothetical protein